MRTEINEKIETLKDMVGSRVAYLEIIKALNPDEEEKNFLLRASVEVRKTEPDIEVINKAYQILVGEDDVQQNSNHESENTLSLQKEADKKSLADTNHIFCPSCGAKLNASVKFCNKCGTKISISRPVDTPSFQQHEPLQTHTESTNPFKKYFIDVIKTQYANFNGVANRTEYWLYALFYFLILIGMFFVTAFLNPELGMIAALLYMVVLAVPSIAIGVRRLHDINLSGWFYLISLVPYIGGIAMLVLAVLPTKYDSKYR